MGQYIINVTELVDEPEPEKPPVVKGFLFIILVLWCLVQFGG